MSRSVLRIWISCLTLLIAAQTFFATAKELSLGQIRLPEGFRIELFTDVPNARSMTLGRKTLFVATRDKGAVYAVSLSPTGARAGRVVQIAKGLNEPNGVAFFNGALYVAEISRILRYDAIEENLESPPKPVVVSDDYPKERHHGWKFIAFGHDGLLYVPVGAPGNNVLREEPIYASITRIRPDGKGREIFAHGVRNTVGFDWHPVTHDLWFTDNGRDWMGDDAPPDELNLARAAGQHFGYPFMHGKAIKDDKYGDKAEPSKYTPPILELGPHVAALGMRFYTGEMFPKEYRHQIFIAEHGSWNRSTPLGYRVMLVRLEEQADGRPTNRALSYEPFAQGWLTEGGRKPWGRPVDVQVMPDGAMLVSDDYAGAIYRISCSAPQGE